MNITERSGEMLNQPLSHEFFLQTGPFTVAVQTNVSTFYPPFQLLYQDHALSFTPTFADFHVTLSRPLNAHYWLRPQVNFLLDGKVVFNPLPLDQVFPIFEWGLNWAIGNHCHYYLVIHAAVLEKNGWGILLPGAPGSGKSTLCAALSLRGWRLLSDELALIDLQTGLCTPIPRPVSLKEQSIEVIRNFSKDAVLSDTVHDTQKGSVAYLKASRSSIEQSAQMVKLRLVIFPKFQAGFEAYELTPITKAEAFIRVADQSFNYHILGKQGFDLLGQVMNACQCYDFYYNGDLQQAEQVFSQLIDALDNPG